MQIFRDMRINSLGASVLFLASERYIPADSKISNFRGVVDTLGLISYCSGAVQDWESTNSGESFTVYPFLLLFYRQISEGEELLPLACWVSDLDIVLDQNLLGSQTERVIGVDVIIDKHWPDESSYSIGITRVDGSSDVTWDPVNLHTGDGILFIIPDELVPSCSRVVTIHV